MSGRPLWSDRLPVEVPPGATDLVVTGPRPFVTAVEYDHPDGRHVRWQARSSRKARSVTQAHPGATRRGLTWWAGLLFALGSTCFVLGPVLDYTQWVSARATAIVYFVGSDFFTIAAYLTYVEVVRETGRRWFGWAPRHMGFWATLVQLVGTLYFNVMTVAAFLDVPAEAVNRVVWRPDIIGSLCFLVASAIAFAEAGHRWWSWRPGERDWHITALNWWGSVFFGLSALGAYTLPSGELLDEAVANGGTLLGAVCFLVAALMLMPEGRS